MSNKDNVDNLNRVLELLSQPLNKYILAVLAGVDPGAFRGDIAVENNHAGEKKTPE